MAFKQFVKMFNNRSSRISLSLCRKQEPMNFRAVKAKSFQLEALVSIDIVTEGPRLTRFLGLGKNHVT